MRIPFLLLAAVAGPAFPASAQVTVDLHALDALPNARPAATRPFDPAVPRAFDPAVPRARPKGQLASAAPEHGPASVSSAGMVASPAIGAVSATGAGRTAAPAGSAAAGSRLDAMLPTGAPPAPPPPSLEASASPPPAPPASAAPAGASGSAAMTAAAVRIAFDPAQSDLNADGTEVIKQLVSGAPKGDNTTFNVVAYAASTPDDPSTARRLSLSRALAVRTALMADGVPSSRIYVRALGGQGGDGPPDRADVSVLGTNAPPSASASPSGKSTP